MTQPIASSQEALVNGINGLLDEVVTDPGPLHGGRYPGPVNGSSRLEQMPVSSRGNITRPQSAPPGVVNNDSRKPPSSEMKSTTHTVRWGGDSVDIRDPTIAAKYAEYYYSQKVRDSRLPIPVSGYFQISNLRDFQKPGGSPPEHEYETSRQPPYEDPGPIAGEYSVPSRPQPPEVRQSSEIRSPVPRRSSKQIVKEVGAGRPKSNSYGSNQLRSHSPVLWANNSGESRDTRDVAKPDSPLERREASSPSNQSFYNLDQYIQPGQQKYQYPRTSGSSTTSYSHPLYSESPRREGSSLGNTGRPPLSPNQHAGIDDYMYNSTANMKTVGSLDHQLSNLFLSDGSSIGHDSAGYYRHSNGSVPHEVAGDISPSSSLRYSSGTQLSSDLQGQYYQQSQNPMLQVMGYGTTTSRGPQSSGSSRQLQGDHLRSTAQPLDHSSSLSSLYVKNTNGAAGGMASFNGRSRQTEDEAAQRARVEAAYHSYQSQQAPQGVYHLSHGSSRTQVAAARGYWADGPNSHISGYGYEQPRNGTRVNQGPIRTGRRYQGSLGGSLDGIPTTTAIQLTPQQLSAAIPGAIPATTLVSTTDPHTHTTTLHHPALAANTVVGTRPPSGTVIGTIYTENGTPTNLALMTQTPAYTENPKLEDVIHANRVVELATDQNGSRFIQQQLEKANAELKHEVFQQIIPKAMELCKDVFGNYVIQKLFEFGLEDHKKALATELQGNVRELTLQMYGCRVIQKALEHLPEHFQVKLIGELKGQIMYCIKDQNGNHVIQKCIEKVPSVHIQFIVESFNNRVVELSTHPYGCRVIQRLLENCTPEQKEPILEEITHSLLQLIKDQYGNYVVQHVLTHGGRGPHLDCVVTIVCENLLNLSKNKYASNVVEKCFHSGSEAQRERLVKVVIGEDDECPLSYMVRDPFGNYVVQNILKYVNDDQKRRIVRRMQECVPNIRKIAYGKHIVACVEKLTGEML